MERQKREKNLIITHFSFYLVLTLLLLFYIFSNLLPKIILIEWLKNNTKELSVSLDKIKKTGISFEEFTSLNNASASFVLKEIMKSIDKNFYDDNLVNKTKPTYDEFIKEKISDLNSEENKKLVAEKWALIQRVLPIYSDDNINLSENWLTDYKFVNYVESILKTFDLSTDSSIWISKVTLVKDFSTSNDSNSENKLWSDIYYIPLNLSLQWTKSWLINFLYFIENVWKIKLKWDEIAINDNNLLVSNKILEWDKLVQNYNIFEHQIVDVDNIAFNEYLDSSYVSLEWESNFTKRILNNQWNEPVDVTLTLLFYVKWQPTYIIEEYINSVLDKYNKIAWIVNKKLSDTNFTWIDRVNYNKYNDVIKELNSDVQLMKRNLTNKEILESNYKDAVRLDFIIDPIFKKISN